MEQSEKRKIIEAILFSAPNGFVSLDHLKQFFQEDITNILEEIKVRSADHGYTLIERNGKIALVTRKEYAEILKNFWGIEEKEFSQASLEVLAVVAYAGPMSLSEINKIRGVNSSYVVNRLVLRGLLAVEKKNERRYYRLSPEFLNFLGITNESELPDYENIRKDLKKS
jgi:segregation and condensation protein B